MVEVPQARIRMYLPPEALTPEERDTEVRALLAHGLLRVVLTRRTETGGLALTGRRVRVMNVLPPRPEVNA
ncbi:MAG: hypothetical protein ACYC7E_04560 [Armatimonadota bacterium]